MDDETTKRLAQTLVGYSLRVQRDEVVVLRGSMLAEPLLDVLYQAVLEANGRPVVQFAADICLDTHFSPQKTLEIPYLNPTGVQAGEAIDCSLGVWALQSSAKPMAIPTHAQIQAELEEQSRFLRYAAAGKIRWAVTLWPTQYAAELAGLIDSQFEEILLKAMMVDTDQASTRWKSFGHAQQVLCDRLAAAQQITIRCSLGTELTLDIGGQNWINSCGRHNLPDGEVFSSPLADSANGRWHSAFATTYHHETISGARLEIENGRVVRATAETGQAALHRMLETDDGASVVGEIGIGTNPAVIRGTGISLLDEKIAGTVHIGLGASYPQTGGTNQSSVHRDFVCDLRTGGSILIDGEPLELPVIRL